MWQYGLFPWRTDEGLIRIEVPLATDAHKLAGLRPRLRFIAIRISGLFKRLLAGTVPSDRRIKRDVPSGL
jgi:hypothetical protein